MRPMAPVLLHPYHRPFLSHATRSSDAAPLKSPKHFSLKVLIQLFAITIAIFVLAVLFWKLGKFLRRFTQDKVVKRGNAVTARYARTWYGWVPAERHTQCKKFFRACFDKLGRWMAWRSSNQDYSWVWWDPGQKELNRYRETRRPLRWLPGWIRSYSFTTADTIWNPRPAESTGGIAAPAGRPQSPSFRMAGALVSYQTLDRVVGSRHTVSRTSICTRVSIKVYSEEVTYGAKTRLETSARARADSVSRGEELRRPAYTRIEARRKFVLAHSTCSFQFASPQRNVQAIVPRLSRCRSLPCLGPDTERFNQRGDVKAHWNCYDSFSLSNEFRVRHTTRYSHVYRMRFARFGLHATLDGSLSPPVRVESPDNLARVLSDLTLLPRMYGLTRRSSGKVSSSNWSSSQLDSRRRSFAANASPLRQTLLGSDIARECSGTSNPGHLFQHRKGSPSLRELETEMCRDIRSDCLSTIPKGLGHKSDAQERLNSRQEAHPGSLQPIRPKAADVELTACDLRLIDDLNRRLEWLSNQLSPGRRPYHFALLANHWLNPETWIVIDPPTRIPIEARRRLGDPRFNEPYPAVDCTPKPKYPQKPRKRADVPKINSWRVAINRHRRARGIEDMIRGVELFEGSIDAPSDGKVDPACWILRKPPQGYSLSSRQGTVFYEGGAGWQETLDDWQKVRRGYRIRKAIHEGKVNRKRAKEIALGITRCYRMGVSKFP